MTQETTGTRLDKWLWAARFFKTRSLAHEAIAGGKVQVGGVRAKPARSVKVGDVLRIVAGEQHWEVVVRGLSDKRGPAPVARLLYEETADSLLARERNAQARTMGVEPALMMRGGRPTKRDRRDIERFRRDDS